MIRLTHEGSGKRSLFLNGVRTMRRFSKLLVVLLIAAVLAGAFGVQALAAGSRNPEAYLPYSPYAAWGYPNTYCSFGDSISAGYDRYENNTIIGYQPTPATSYPSLVAAATNTYHCPFSFIGFRSSELLLSLGGDIGTPDAYHATGYAWMYSEDGTCHYWQDSIAPAVTTASLMTVNVGNNDVLTAPLSLAAVDVLEAGEKWQENENAIAALIESGDLPQTLAGMYQLMNRLGYYKEYIPAVLARMQSGLEQIKTNMPQIIAQLRSVNTTGQIVIVGMYNPYDSMKLTDQGLLQIGKMGGLLVDQVNAYYKQLAAETGCVYADVTDTESYADLNPTALLSGGLREDAHPTHKGHAYLAKQILDAIPVILPYTDVPEEQWYRESVDYCYRNSLMVGTAADVFSPDEYMTRAMVVTVLWRLAGSPSVEGEMQFSDVAAGSWYFDAVNWAYQNKIVSGIGFGKFAPDQDVSRQDFMTMLYRYAQFEGFVDRGGWNLLERFGFKDLRSAAAYALDSLRWAFGNGILNGVNSTSIDPTGRLTRAQCAALIMRFDKNIYTA